MTNLTVRMEEGRLSPRSRGVTLSKVTPRDPLKR